MTLTTRYNLGQTVWAASRSRRHTTPIGPLTIGQVQKTVTDSPGISEETIFDNYKAQQGTEERYMCIETGIGSGTLYYVQDLFLTEQEAQAELTKQAPSTKPTE